MSVTAEKPAPAPDRVSLRARAGDRGATLEGVGRFYIPEARREEIASGMEAVAGRALTDLRVSADGEAALVGLRIGEKSYGQ